MFDRAIMAKVADSPLDPQTQDRAPAFRRGSSLLVLVSFVGLLAGCLPFLRPAKAPLESIAFPASKSSDCLVVLLPGRFGSPQNFFDAQFPERLEAAGLTADLIAVDAHLGYYRKRSVVDRLRADIVQPAIADGYREIWLVGASLGGLGAFLYARDHAQDLTGVVALAPFLGDKKLAADIRAQGGLRQWRPTQEDASKDFPRLWQWLRDQAAIPHAPLSLYLAFGTEDRLATSAQLLAEALPRDHTFTTPGKHDWKVWGKLWEEFLSSGTLCSSVTSD